MSSGSSGSTPAMRCHPRIEHAAVIARARSSVFTRTITGRFSDPSFAMKSLSAVQDIIDRVANRVNEKQDFDALR
jgi:hypothetical protein